MEKIFYIKLIQASLGGSLNVLVFMAQTAPFLMICEKCMIRKLTTFFGDKGAEIEFEENEKLIHEDGCKLQKKKWEEYVFLEINAVECANCEFRIYCEHNNKK